TQARHEECGSRLRPMRARAERTGEGIEVRRLLMTRDRATFKGRHYQLDAATYRPRPVQKPHPPIWIGAEGEQLMLPIVGRQADAWHAYGSPTSLARKSKLIDEHAQRAGRDPTAIPRSSSPSLSRSWDEVRKHAERLAGAGLGYLVVSW